MHVDFPAQRAALRLPQSVARGLPSDVEAFAESNATAVTVCVPMRSPRTMNCPLFSPPGPMSGIDTVPLAGNVSFLIEFDKSVTVSAN